MTNYIFDKAYEECFTRACDYMKALVTHEEATISVKPNCESVVIGDASMTITFYENRTLSIDLMFEGRPQRLVYYSTMELLAMHIQGCRPLLVVVEKTLKTVASIGLVA